MPLTLAEAPSARSRRFELAPARLLVQPDAERGLAHNLMRQRGVGRMEPATSHVAVQPLELVRFEHPSPARGGHRQVDDLLGAFDAVVLGCHDLHRPGWSMI